VSRSELKFTEFWLGLGIRLQWWTVTRNGTVNVYTDGDLWQMKLN